MPLHSHQPRSALFKLKHPGLTSLFASLLLPRTADMGSLLADSSSTSFPSLLNTSPSCKSPSTRPQVSQPRRYPRVLSDVPSASRMRQRISEAFGSSNNIIYTDGPGVPDSSLSLPDTTVAFQSRTPPPRPSPLSSSPTTRTARRPRIPSSLPPSSPPCSSDSSSANGDDHETEEPACVSPHHRKTNPDLQDPYGLLRGQQIFSRLRRRHRRQKKNVVAAAVSIVTPCPRPRPRNNALGQLENLSPMTPRANSSTGRTPDPKSKFHLLPSSRLEPTHQGRPHHHDHPEGDGQGGRGGGGGGGESGNSSDPRGGASDALSDLLARLPRRKRQLQQQNSRRTSVPATKPAGEKVREKRKTKKKRASDEASHLKGEVRVVRNTVDIFLS
jgi:hypothetical protein